MIGVPAYLASRVMGERFVVDVYGSYLGMLGMWREYVAELFHRRLA